MPVSPVALVEKAERDFDEPKSGSESPTRVAGSPLGAADGRRIAASPVYSFPACL